MEVLSGRPRLGQKTYNGVLGGCGDKHSLLSFITKSCPQSFYGIGQVGTGTGAHVMVKGY